MFVGRPFMPGRTEVEQLQRIFKLCGSPSEDYWNKMKLPASFHPPRHYRPSFEEAFSPLPTSSFGLLTTLLALDQPLVAMLLLLSIVNSLLQAHWPAIFQLYQFPGKRRINLKPVIRCMILVYNVKLFSSMM
ncbi:hypothetical protein I3842_08G008900 [Carya illinoinensis]|uniref:Uncharacterized protein n=1 Tax=Carya illinoinensis TaxID=32201 RepID=A0A922J812_CARIL|nr:hypothetical protein I3842_08G008900 [Carya illinoinensis]